MQSKEKQGLIIIRLFDGEDLFQLLKEASNKHRIETAVILSSIGQLRQFTLGYFNGKEYINQDFPEAHELLSISGIISSREDQNDRKLHLHAVLGNEQKQVIGGHLFKGIIESTGEVVLLKTTIKVKRRKDENTGLQALYLE